MNKTLSEYRQLDQCVWTYEEEVVKEAVKRLKKSIDESADKTDIWDNERWTKFRRILRKEIKEIFGEKLI